MHEASKPVYLVDPFSDPVLVRIEGRAGFQNSGSLRDFVKERITSGKRRFVIDFHECAAMDSTFLGVLAGAALELRKSDPPGSLIVARPGVRNLELIRNLGLHHLLTVDAGVLSCPPQQCKTPLDGHDRSEIDTARMVLEAHECLANADEANRARFQDVLTFLRTRVDQG